MKVYKGRGYKYKMEERYEIKISQETLHCSPEWEETVKMVACYTEVFSCAYTP